MAKGALATLPARSIGKVWLQTVMSLSLDDTLTDGLNGLGDPPSEGGEERGELCELSPVETEPKLPSFSCFLTISGGMTTSGAGLAWSLRNRSNDRRSSLGDERFGEEWPGPVGVEAPGEVVCREGGKEWKRSALFWLLIAVYDGIDACWLSVGVADGEGEALAE